MSRIEGPIASWRGLTKTYGTATARVEALVGITAEVPRGALTAIVGPSGSGKSTLLRLLGGMDRPTSGEIHVASTPIDTASARALRRLRRSRIGYVFQRPSDNFVSFLTVGDHVRAAARHAPADVDAVQVLDRLGIGERADHLPAELSGGEQQRGAIAQALVAGAELVIADEPTAELDEESAAALLEQVHSLVDGGVTFIVATHDRTVTRRADLVLEIRHGKLIAEPGRRRRGGVDVVPADRRHRIEAPTRLQVRGVTKTFRRGDEQVHALADVTFDVREGEVAGLIGRSGSGKSTLLNVVAGWEAPDAGEIVWADGSDVGASPAWSHLAVLPQKLGLLDELTVRENVEYPLRLSGVLGERRDAVDELLERLDLAPLERRHPKETSVGEQQRTALARALVGSPALLLLDEPTSHQDERSARAVMDAVRAAAAHGTGCLIATHGDELLQDLDAELRLTDGRLVSEP